MSRWRSAQRALAALVAGTLVTVRLGVARVVRRRDKLPWEVSTSPPHQQALSRARGTGQAFVFLNRRNEPLTRFGIYSLVRRAVDQASRALPSLAEKRISPHCLRHSCAVHLLRSGVDINTIRAWLGHVSLDTTHIYAEVDLEMKAKALALCDLPDEVATKPWHSDPGLIGFLRAL